MKTVCIIWCLICLIGEVIIKFWKKLIFLETLKLNWKDTSKTKNRGQCRIGRAKAFLQPSLQRQVQSLLPICPFIQRWWGVRIITIGIWYKINEGSEWKRYLLTLHYWITWNGLALQKERIRYWLRNNYLVITRNLSFERDSNNS